MKSKDNFLFSYAEKQHHKYILKKYLKGSFFKRR